MKKFSQRQIINKIAANNKVIHQAERLSEKLYDFHFDNENERLEKAIAELNGMANIKRYENNRLFKEFNELVKKDNKKLYYKKQS